MDNWEGPPAFTITDLKQHIYCARISYYHLCLPDVRPVTRKMTIGIEQHGTEQERAARRTMAMYGNIAGERRFDVELFSRRLNLTGRADELVFTPEEIIPVDYKIARQSGKHYETQLAAYGMMAEEMFSQPVRRGYIYLTKAKKAVEIRISSQLRKLVERAVYEMGETQRREKMPAATEWPQRCLDCEFRRFCNDV